MTGNPSPPRSGKAPASRAERLAEALRANLRRRKEQRRARKQAGESGEPARQDGTERQ